MCYSRIPHVEGRDTKSRHWVGLLYNFSVLSLGCLRLVVQAGTELAAVSDRGNLHQVVRLILGHLCNPLILNVLIWNTWMASIHRLFQGSHCALYKVWPMSYSVNVHRISFLIEHFSRTKFYSTIPTEGYISTKRTLLKDCFMNKGIHMAQPWETLSAIPLSRLMLVVSWEIFKHSSYY